MAFVDGVQFISVHHIFTVLPSPAAQLEPEDGVLVGGFAFCEGSQEQHGTQGAVDRLRTRSW